MFIEQYLRPRSVEETLGLLAEYGDDAKVVAGGQSLMVLLHEGLVAPRVLIGLSAVPELAGITTNGEARIGALATHTQVLNDPGIRASWPVLAAAEQAVSSVQIRNRGTLCGNLAHAYPTADPPAALLALDAVLTLRSPRGSRIGPRTSRRAMAGRLIRKTDPHQKCCSRTPLSTGPSAMPPVMMPVQAPIAWPR